MEAVERTSRRFYREPPASTFPMCDDAPWTPHSPLPPRPVTPRDVLWVPHTQRSCPQGHSARSGASCRHCGGHVTAADRRQQRLSGVKEPLMISVCTQIHVGAREN
jgi:hypothetical protein